MDFFFISVIYTIYKFISLGTRPRKVSVFICGTATSQNRNFFSQRGFEATLYTVGRYCWWQGFNPLYVKNEYCTARGLQCDQCVRLRYKQRRACTVMIHLLLNTQPEHLCKYTYSHREGGGGRANQREGYRSNNSQEWLKIPKMTDQSINSI